MIQLLTLEAKAVIKRYKPKIVAVTGSVGKTATKDAIYTVLAASTHVRKSEKSFNSEIGLPLTILGIPNAWNNPFAWFQNLLDGLFLIVFKSRYPQWLVLEVGADRPGDIKSVAAWLPVTIAVITRLPEMPVHVEFFDSPQQVVEEKATLIDALVPDGALVLYGDDERTEDFRRRAQYKKVVTFGLSPTADVRADDFNLLQTPEHEPVGMSATLTMQGASAPLEVIGTVGTHTLLPALAAAAVGTVVEKDIAQVLAALKSYKPPLGRMRLLKGIKDSIIIDDTYNSSPAAVEAALDTLKMLGRAAADRGIPPRRRIAVLGDMLELGRHSTSEHKKIGEHVAKTANLLVTVGFRARDIAQGALDAGMKEVKILQCERAEQAGEELAKILKAHDIVLVKGSQSMRMEKTVEALMAQPQKAAQLLVRQDAQWRRR